MQINSLLAQNVQSQLFKSAAKVQVENNTETYSVEAIPLSAHKAYSKIAFSGKEPLLKTKGEFCIDNADIPDEVWDFCDRKGYSPIGMGLVYNKADRMNEQAYLVFSNQDEECTIYLLNEEGKKLGKNTFEVDICKEPSYKGTPEYGKYLIMGGYMDNRCQDEYKYVGTLMHKAKIAMALNSGMDLGFATVAKYPEAREFHKIFGLSTSESNKDYFYLGEARKEELEKEFEKNPVIFTDAEFDL